MTERVRRRVSKWDLKEDPDKFPTETRQDIALSGKASESIHDNGSKQEWNSSNNHTPKWSDTDPSSALKSEGNSGWSCWEPLSGNRAEQKDDNVNRNFNEVTQTMKTWDGDQSYSTSMSPGLDGWRQRSRSRSPKSGWNRSQRSRSRSRSRSPPHSLRRDSEGWNDRIRGGSGVSAPPCNDFARGKCRRGSQCRFLHQGSSDYDGRRHSGSASSENWGSRHERGGSSGHANNVERDYARDKLSLGHEPQRDNRSSGRCINFLKGKCYRGSSCRFIHDNSVADDQGPRERTHERDTKSYFGNDHRREPHRNNNIPCKYFATGNCRNGVNCRFSHEGAAHDRPEGRSVDDRRGHDLGDQNKSWGGPKWSDEAADSAHGSVEGRSLSDRWGHNLDDGNRSWDGPKWNDKAADSEATKLPQWRNDANGGKMGDKGENGLWGGPKWSDKAAESEVTRSSQWGNGNDVKTGIPVLRPTERSLDGRWDHSLGDQNGRRGGPTWIDKPSNQDGGKPPHWICDNSSASMGVQLSRGHDELLNVASMPSARAERDHEKTELTIQSSQSRCQEVVMLSHEQTRRQEVSGHQCHIPAVIMHPAGQLHHAPTVLMHPAVSENVHNQQLCSLEGASVFPCDYSNAVTNSAKPHNEVNVSVDVPVHGQTFNHKDNMVSQPSPSFNMNAQSQHLLPSPAPSVRSFDLNGPVEDIQSPHHQTLFHLGETMKEAGIIDQKMSPITSGVPVTQSTVTSEQLAQVTNLSASLAQIFGNGQQLPQLYATLNSSSMGLVPSHPNSAAPVASVVAPFVQSNQDTWSQKQYDPISDGIESSRISMQPPGFSANPVEQNKSADQESQTPMQSVAPSSVTGEPNGSDPSKNSSLEKTLHHQNNELKHSVENERAADCNVQEQDTVHAGDTNVDEEGKRSKDAKAMRMFKFALVEFVKEVLKPTWKEGQLSKEAHKTVVKKVVDKVTGSIQGAHIPQTQEKLDQYMSYSKPKLTKLVQAYVEKYVKT